jgi:glycosyltransferase involved in cell wall biosynthesis
MDKILYVSTISNTIESFMVPHINMLLDQGYKIDIACNEKKNRELNKELKEKGVKFFQIDFQRQIFNLKNYKAYKDIKSLIKRNDYDIVHTHTPIASAITRLACKNLKDVKIMYTAHGFHFFKGGSLKNWIFFPVEYWLSKYTDMIITINKEDYNLANNYFKSRYIEFTHGVGFEVDKFTKTRADKNKILKKLNIPSKSFIILSVGLLEDRKNHETIIRAIKQLEDEEVYYLIAGEGHLKNKLNNLLKKLNLSKQVRLLGFRDDIPELCQISDLFAFPSKREGLGIAALEAMASGLPVLTSNVQGIKDYSIDGKTGFTYKYDDVAGFADGIKKIKNDKKLRERLKNNALKSVQKYDISNALQELKKLYEII